MVGFVILAVLMVAGAIGVITLRQPVHAALSLVATLLALAVTYVTLQAHFLAAVQVIVYAGAIMVLFLFVIMLLNIQGEKRRPHLSWIGPVALAVGLVGAAAVSWTAFSGKRPLPSADAVASALRGGNAGAIGDVLFGNFVLAFQLVAVLLLTGIIGAVSLAQRRGQRKSLASPERPQEMRNV